MPKQLRPIFDYCILKLCCIHCSFKRIISYFGIFFLGLTCSFMMRSSHLSMTFLLLNYHIYKVEIHNYSFIFLKYIICTILNRWMSLAMAPAVVLIVRWIRGKVAFKLFVTLLVKLIDRWMFVIYLSLRLSNNNS